MTDIELRAKSFANYIIENRATVRATAKYFGTSKSTVHKDVSERLLKFSPSLAKEAKKILDYNLEHTSNDINQDVSYEEEEL